MDIPVMRPAGLEDAGLAADMMTVAYPLEPHDPVLIRFRWEHPPERWSFGRFIAAVKSEPIGFLSWSHGPWEDDPERHCELEAWLDRARHDPDLFAWLVAWIAAQAVEQGARILIIYSAEDTPDELAVFERLGYARDRADRVWELDLGKHGKRLVAEAEAARKRTAGTGIQLTTLAQFPDPDKLRKLHALNEITRRDVPHTAPVVPQSYENYRTRISAPDVRDDRLWIAIDGDRVVAMSLLRFPPVRGNIWTGYTCSHPDYRGRGIARAVKLQSLAQAVELGITSIRTANDSENAPMLHINETLGYTLRPGFVSYIKRVET